MIRSRFFRFLSRAIVFPIIFSLVLATSYLPTQSTEQVEAGGAAGIVYDPTNWIQNAISAVMSRIISSLTDALVIKEYTLDAIAFAIINMMIQQMSQDIVRWINSGFEGDPAFIRNFDGFLTGVGDRAVSEFLGGTELAQYLCSPFRIQIQAALEIQYTATRNFGSSQNSCTLAGIEQNIRNFMDGNIVAGNWDDWFRITQNPQYNTHGAMLAAQQKLSMNVGNVKAQQTTVLGWGKGFLSQQDCQTVENRRVCRTITPGSAIEDSLNEALGSPGRRIAVADEINEIFAALFNQLVTQAFSGVGGLLGLTGGGGTPQNTYYSNLYSQPSGASQTDLGSLIQQAITNETRYATLQQDMINRLQTAANYRDTNYPGNTTCHPGVLTPALQAELSSAQANLLQANTSLVRLNQINANFIAAGSDPDLIRTVYQEYIAVQSTGQLHTEAENNTIQNIGIQALQDEIDRFTGRIDTACGSAGN
jgi:hypothetical protein